MKREFNKYLEHLDEDELREELARLYKRFPVLREYYQMELGDSKKLIDKYKKNMRKAFFPSRGRGRRGRSISRKHIKAFSEISIRPVDLIELHFYRAELMMEYAKTQQITSDGFLDSITSSFREACAMAEAEVLVDYFREPVGRLLEYYRLHYYNRWAWLRLVAEEYGF